MVKCVLSINKALGCIPSTKIIKEEAPSIIQGEGYWGHGSLGKSACPTSVTT